jgi:hypothetical protein
MMKSCLVSFFLCISFLSIVMPAKSAELLIVSSVENNEQLTREMIKQIYLQGEQGNGQIQPVNVAKGAMSRTIFNTLVMGLTESRLQSYWSQMRFTGRSKPPLELESEQALIEHLLNVSTAIGYVIVNDEDKLHEGLKILVQLPF